MKKLYRINDRGDIRPGHATDDEIIAVAEGRGEGALASVSVGDDGEIVATPLTTAQIEAAADAARARQEQARIDATGEVGKITAALDLSLELQARIAALPYSPALRWHGVLTVWPDDQPDAEEALRRWASAREYAVKEGWSHYEDGTSIRSLSVCSGHDEVARAQWRQVKTENHPAARADKEARTPRLVCEAAS